MDHRICILLFAAVFNSIYALPRIYASGMTNPNRDGRKLNLNQNLNDALYDFVENGSYEDVEDGDNNMDNKDADKAKELKSDYKREKYRLLADKAYSLQRSIRAGDTFTPQELLPVTKRFLEKVDNPGEGKGIVSSAKSPEALADTLFQAYFITSKRIVTLQDEDLSGLDALQALSLNGDAVDLRMASGYSYTEKPARMFNSEGELVNQRREPGKCHYRVITKKISRNEKPNTRRRKGLSFMNKRGKKRHLIVNAGRRSKKRNSASESVAKGKTKNQAQRKANKAYRKENKSTDCHWKYQCRDIVNLDTCRLHMVCPKDTRASHHTTDDIFVDHFEDEHLTSIAQFRKMLGMTILDEEVEKIIESHVLRKRPQNIGANEKIQTLEEYFNGIIMAEHSGTTPAIDPETQSLVLSDDKKSTVTNSLPELKKRHRRHVPTTPMPKQKHT